MSNLLTKMHARDWIKVHQKVKNLKKITVALNQKAQENYDIWSGDSRVRNIDHIVKRIAFRINKQLGRETKFLEEGIRKEVNIALWLLARQQVNVLTPMEAFVELEIVTDPLPLLVMQEKFATDMRDVLTGNKYDPVWEEAMIRILRNMPGYNVVAAGKALHVDYDFPNALLYTKEQVGRVPSVEEWSKGFAPVLSGMKQTQKEMNANLPLNIFNIGTRMPLALDQFFYWRNQPFQTVHGTDAKYEYPSEEIVELLDSKTKFLPFNYRMKPPPSISYDPEGILQKREENNRKN